MKGAFFLEKLNQSKNSQLFIWIGILIAFTPDALILIVNSVLNRKFRQECKSLLCCRNYNQISQNTEPWELSTFFSATIRRVSNVGSFGFFSNQRSSNFSSANQRNSLPTLINQNNSNTLVSVLELQRYSIYIEPTSNSYNKESRSSMLNSHLKRYSIASACSSTSAIKRHIKKNLPTSNLNLRKYSNPNTKTTNSKINEPTIHKRIQRFFRKNSTNFFSQKDNFTTSNDDLELKKSMKKRRFSLNEITRNSVKNRVMNKRRSSLNIFTFRANSCDESNKIL